MPRSSCDRPSPLRHTSRPRNHRPSAIRSSGFRIAGLDRQPRAAFRLSESWQRSTRQCVALQRLRKFLYAEVRGPLGRVGAGAVFHRADSWLITEAAARDRIRAELLLEVGDAGRGALVAERARPGEVIRARDVVLALFRLAAGNHPIDAGSVLECHDVDGDLMGPKSV